MPIWKIYGYMSEDNLEAAADGENYEWTDMYESMAKDADEFHQCP